MFRRLRLFWLLLLSSVAVCALSPVALADATESDLRTLLDAFLDGASRSDRAMHDRFWAEDLVYTSSAGLRFGKAAILDGLPPEPVPGTARYGAEDVNVRVEGDIAVITFRLVATGEDGSRDTFFNTGVFRQVDSEWRAFTWQATREAEGD